MNVYRKETRNNLAKNSKQDKKDNCSTRVEVQEDFEEHQRMLRYTEDVRKKYHASCRQMISELRPSHLDEFADVLRERHKHILQDRDELIKEMGEKLVRSLCNSLDKFWEEYDVANQLAALEKLKEQYKQYEGNTWNVLQMDPFQRTLALRMHYKEARIEYLEKQLALQNEHLKKLMEINHRERCRIEDMDYSRKSTLENMERCNSISAGLRFSSEYAKIRGNLQKQGTLQQHALEYGTKLVGCVSLKKGGTTHLGFPVFASPEQKRQLIGMQLLFMLRHRELLLLS
ncbi:uncharacterized protein Nnf1a isoform X3 [Eurosta solidaginis]|uniref:uncharacterized protein Nnf1a isoform X3 n=1 Tax=Eurosta solidaginis TaxID=178769 RepID=UPI003530BADC